MRSFDRQRPQRGLRPQRHLRSALAGAVAAALALLAVVLATREDAPQPGTAPAEPLPVHAMATPSPLPWSAPAGTAQARTQPAPGARAPGLPTRRERIERAAESDDVRLRAQAYRLLRDCAPVLAPGSARPLVAPPAWMAWETVRRADQAWQALASRCESLQGLPDRDKLQRRLDPVPAFDPNQGPPLAADGRWLAATFREHGAAALLWAGDALAAYNEQRSSAADGDGFETLDPEAVQIARCRLGEDCGADSDAAQAACLTVGACEGDVPQRILSTLGSRAVRERVLRQAAALAESLEKGDLARFALGR
jgi:hypothetical protein